MTDARHTLTHFAPGTPPPGLDDRAHAAVHAKQIVPSGTHELTLPDLFAAVQRAAVLGRKGDAGYLVAGRVEGTRSNTATGPASLAIVDADDAAPPWDLLAEFEGFGHTTASHGLPGPDGEPRSCWRFYIPFTEPVAHGQLPAPWPGAHIRARSQPAFLPTHRSDPSAIEFRWLGGSKRLDGGAATPQLAPASESLLAALFEAAGWALREQSTGLAVICPWVHEHTCRDQGGTVVLHADPDGQGLGKFHCSHGHCAGRGSRDALAVLRQLPAVQAELRHWPEPTGLGGVWTRVDEPPKDLPPPPHGAELAPAALVSVPGTDDVRWNPHTQDLTGAPSRVQRALERWRRDQAGGGIARPQLQESAACLRWLALDARVPAAELQRWFGEQAGRLATELQRNAANPEVQAAGRLTQIDGILTRPGIELRYNEMSLTIQINGRPWSDADTADARLACEHAGVSAEDKPVPNGDIEQRAKRLAMLQSYHPVREYFDSLPEWDRTVRLETLWVRYFGADATARNHALGVCFALGAVRRVLTPGCKVDMMPILYGPQGRFKSTAIAALAGQEFFSDAKLNFSHRSENAMTLAECWILEVAELEGFNRAEQTAVKAFTSIQVDRVLLPYARVKTARPRTSVMIGTTNEDRPLKDPTGNRRYPVIEAGRIDVPALVQDRDQLWAEALLRASTAEPHWLSPELELEAADANEAHTESDEAWTEQLRKWLANPTLCKPGAWQPTPFPTANGFTVGEALTHAMGVEPARQGRAEQTRIGIALKRLGCRPQRAGDKRVRRYMFPPPIER